MSILQTVSALVILAGVASAAAPARADNECKEGLYSTRLRCLEDKLDKLAKSVDSKIAGVNTGLDSKIAKAFDRNFQITSVRRPGQCIKWTDNNGATITLTCDTGDGDWQWKLLPK